MAQDPEDEHAHPAGVPLMQWDRREEESEQAYEAFEAYREMGLQRSLAKVAAQLGKSVTLMERWNQRHEWRRRVLAWDRHEARTINERVLAGTAVMRERLSKIGMNMQIQAAKRVGTLKDEELAGMSMQTIIALARVGADIEAKARAITPEELEGAARDSAPTFKIGFVSDVPRDMVGVRLGDGTTGYIPRAAIPQFRSDFPEATVIA